MLGAVYGALLVNAAKTAFSESMPQVWLFAMGGLFIAVVMLFPEGLAGLYRSYLDRWVSRLPFMTARAAEPVALHSVVETQ